MKFINYKGNDIVIDKITSISKVKTISTGSLQCDWDFGFTINMGGDSIDIVVPTETDLDGNHKISREGRKDFADREKKYLMGLITKVS